MLAYDRVRQRENGCRARGKGGAMQSMHNEVQGAVRRARPAARLPMLLTLPVLLTLSACDVPRSMHVTAGMEPKYEDDDVRFRTTYYFRVFDVCDTDEPAASGGKGGSATAGSALGGGQQKLAKDSIYRFRMTGKASSLFSKVHFESGTLKSYQIDPFGADVAFDGTNGRFYVRSQDETQADARNSATMARIRMLEGMRNREGLGAAVQAELDAQILSAIRSLGPGTRSPPTASEVVRRLVTGSLQAQDAVIAAKKAALAAEGKTAAQIADDAEMKKLLGARTSHGDSQKTLHDDLVGLFTEAGTAAKNAVDALEVMVKAIDEKKLPDSADDKTRKAHADLRAAVRLQLAIAMARQEDIRRAGNAELLAATLSTAAGAPGEAACSAGSRTRRGFQILGPEGIRTFNQDERLIMAMNTDGGPLISMLQELSGRVLAPKLSDAEQLLPLATERNRLGTARRELEASPADLKAAQDKIKAAIETLQPKVTP